MSEMNDRKITQNDVDGLVNYLRIFRPDKANEEYAREVLEYWKATSRRLALTEPEALNKLLEAFEQANNKGQL